MSAIERLIIYPALGLLGIAVISMLSGSGHPAAMPCADCRSKEAVTATAFYLVDQSGQRVSEWTYDQHRHEARLGGQATKLAARAYTILDGDRNLGELGVAGPDAAPRLVFYGRSTTDGHTTLLESSRLDLSHPELPLSGITLSVDKRRLPENPAARLRVRGEVLIMRGGVPLGDGLILSPNGRVLLREGSDIRQITARGD